MSSPRASKFTTATIIRRCCDGARLVKTNIAGHAVFSLEPGGEVSRRHRHAAVEAINSGKLKPQHDGLFADFSQTWTGGSNT